MAPVPTRKPVDRQRRTAARAKVLALAVAVIGVDAAQAQALRIQQTLTARLSYTDNARAGSDGKGSFVGELTPGLIVSTPEEGGRIDGRLDVRLRNSLRASNNESQERNRSFVSLRGSAEVEAVKRLLFVDMDASINRSSVSSFSGRAPGDFLSTDESTETRMYALGPRLQFKLWGEADGSVRYLRRWLDSGGRGFSAQNLSQSSAHLGNPNQNGLFGWALDYVRNESTYDRSGFGDVTETTSRATLIWNMTRRFHLRGTVGHESNDYVTGVDNSGSILGVGFDWIPSPRTSLAASTEKRTFGRGFDVRLNHRRPMSNWSLSYVKNIASALRPVVSSAWDELYQQFFDAFAGLVPDPVQRDELARALLTRLGVPDDPFLTGAVTNVHFIDKTLSGAVSMVGARNVVTLTAQRSERERIGAEITDNPLDDLSRFRNVKQTSASLYWNHKLSGLTSLNTGLTRIRSEGSGGAPNAEVRRLVASVGLSSTLGARTVGSLTYRHQRAEGSTDFRENVLTASVTMTF